LQQHWQHQLALERTAPLLLVLVLVLVLLLRT
jgi:hypothetical protein